MLILDTNTNEAARVKVIIAILYWSLLIPFHSVTSFDPICPLIPLTYDQIKKWTQSYPRLDSAQVMVENDTIDRGVESDFIIGDNGNCDGNGGDNVTKN